MEKIIQQQILLCTGTHFSSRQCWQKLNPGKQHLYSEADRLQDACWNGMLKEMLPEVCNENDKDLYLWQIRENKYAIDIEIGQMPAEVEPQFSIDPYSFIESVCFN